MPAATGIGSRGEKIMCYILASNAHNHLKKIENNLQISAYHYPQKYGPKPPSFARGTYRYVNHDKFERPQVKLFISGTASIRGHETVHVNNLPIQIQTTMENIENLISHKNFEFNNIHDTKYSMKDISHLKIYFRNSNDFMTIKRTLVVEWHIDENKMFFFNVNICRSDLLLEIEGAI